MNEKTNTDKAEEITESGSRILTEEDVDQVSGGNVKFSGVANAYRGVPGSGDIKPIIP